MSRTLAVALFVCVITLVSSLVHYYFWTRFVRNTVLTPPWRRIATWLFVLLAVGLPLSLVLVRTLIPGLRHLISYPVYIWMGLAFILFVFLLVADLLRLTSWANWRIRRGQPVDPGRRAFMSRMIAGGVTAGAITTASLATRKALSMVKTKRLQIKLSRLPLKLDGFTLVQITDLHVGDILGREWLEGIVQRVNALKPDLIVITGDLVDGSVARLSQTVACLARLEAAHGVYFVTGNHEYYSGVEQWLEHLPSLGIRVLRNERVSIGEGAVSFDLAGIDDHHGARRMAVHGPAGARRGAVHGPDLKRAVAGRDPRRELVLLAHQPVAIFEASRLGVGLQLSGHTHGGQIWPMKYLVRLQQPYISGLVQHGPTQLYVSEGTGFWGPPMRLGTTSEITRITLRAQ